MDSGEFVPSGIAAERAHAALDALPHAVMLLTPQRGIGGREIVDFVIDYANPASVAATGIPRDALEGHPLHIVRPGFPEDLFAAYVAVLETGEPFQRTQSFAAAGGLTFDIAAVSLGDALLVVTQDVSAPAASRTAAERYRALLEATPDWVAFADGAGRLLYINPGGRKMVGLAPDADITGSAIGTFSPEWTRERSAAEALPVASREGVWRGDMARLHADGTEIPVSQVVIARRGADGEVDFYATIARDVSRERAAVQALRESEERFRVAFEQAPIGIALLTLDGGIVQVNDAYCRTVRRTREQLAGLTVHDITHPDDRDLTTHELQRTVVGREPGSSFEKRYLDPDGEVIWVEISAGIFHDSAGDPQYIIGQIQDVGERRVAHVLQRSMLTTRLPKLDGLEVAVRYLPTSGDAEVGGDWYDVIELPGGRVGIVVGDVVGRGVEAAGTMSQLRTALRAYAVEGLRPGEIVLRLHRLVDRLGDGLSTTLVLLDVDPGTGDLRYVSAGHLPPALRSPDGTTRLLEDGRSTPLGTAPLLPPPTEGRYTLAAGETVLLYTDGLIERRESSLDDGLEAMRTALAAAPEALEDQLDHLVGTLLGDQQRHDDVALLALRSEGCEQPPLTAQIADGAAGLSAARAALRGWLLEAGASDEDVTDVLLAAGEASANAVEHGDVPVELKARRHGRQIVLTVRDSGAWRPPQRSAQRGHGLRMMRLLMDSVQVVPTPEGTQVDLRRTLGAGVARPAPEERTATQRPAAVVEVARDGRVPVARLAGEIDLGGAAALRTALAEVLEPSDRGLVVDLGRVSYLDSAGLHMLHDLARTLMRQGQALRLAAPADPALARVLELTGMSEVIPVDATIADAVAKI